MASVSRLSFFNEVVTATENADKQSLNQRSKAFVGFVKLSGRSAGDYTAKLQHSPNGTDWTDLATFAALTANGSEVVQITVNVLPYIRAVVTVANGPGDGTLLVQLWYDEDK